MSSGAATAGEGALGLIDEGFDDLADGGGAGGEEASAAPSSGEVPPTQWEAHHTPRGMVGKIGGEEDEELLEDVNGEDDIIFEESSHQHAGSRQTNC
jgi:hypothetical protein